VTPHLAPLPAIGDAACSWDFQRRQTPISAPGRHAAGLAQLSLDPIALVESIGRMVLNFVTDRSLIAPALFHERYAQVDLRTTEAMLDALVALSPEPLHVWRTPAQRILGNCRDTALLCASALRAGGVPARIRYGFSHHLYQRSAPLHEHAVTEFHDGEWKSIDCRVTSELLARHRIDLTPGQILPPGLFLPALGLWKLCRTGQMSFAEFGGHRRDRAQGMSYLAKLVYLDIAALNGFEPLIWDAWGPPLYRTAPVVLDDPEELEMLDGLANCDPCSTESWLAMKAKYEASDMVRVPRTVVSYSPHSGLRKWTIPVPAHAFQQESSP